MGVVTQDEVLVVRCGIQCGKSVFTIGVGNSANVGSSNKCFSGSTGIVSETSGVDSGTFTTLNRAESNYILL